MTPDPGYSVIAVLREVLHLHDGRLYFEDAPLTGLCFERKGDLIQGHHVADGIVLGPYQPLFVPVDSRHLQADVSDDFGPSDYAAQLFRGQNFTGVAYLFENGRREYEGFFHGGTELSHVWWNQDFSLHYFFESTDDNDLHFGQEYQWHDRHQLKSASIQTSAVFSGGMSFTDQGLLWFLYSHRSFLKRLGEIAPHMRFPPIRDWRELTNMPYAKELSLWGEDIDTEVFDLLQQGGCLQNVAQLSLNGTSLTPDTFQGPGLESLQKLKLQYAKTADHAFAAAIQAACPEFKYVHTNANQRTVTLSKTISADSGCNEALGNS